MGLADLGNFLQHRTEWNVQKPILQQQAADTHALSLSQQKLADVQSKAAAREWAKQNLTLDPSLVTSVANSVPDAEPLPAIPPPEEAPPSPTSPVMPDVEPMPAILPPAEPPAYGPDDPIPDSAKYSSRKEMLDYLKAGAPDTTLAALRPPRDNEVPGSSASPTTPTPAAIPNLSSTAGAAEGTLPQVDLPAPAQRPRPLMAHDLLTTPFYALPEEAQTEILRQGREQMETAGYKITDQELVEHYNQNQQRALPLLSPQSMMGGGMVPTKFSSKDGIELVNPNLGGAASGPGNQQYHYDPLTSQNVENKNFWTDDIIQKNQNTLAQQEIASQQLTKVAEVLKRNPGVVGAVSGTKAGQMVRQAAAALGYKGAYTDENTLRQWLADQMKNVMGSVSNVKNQMEFENLQKAITDPKWTVENWKDAVGRASAGLNAERASLQANFQAHGLQPPDSSQTLPAVNQLPQVTRPGGSAPAAAGNVISTKAEFNALHKGDKFVWQYPDGTTRPGTK